MPRYAAASACTGSRRSGASSVGTHVPDPVRSHAEAPAPLVPRADRVGHVQDHVDGGGVPALRQGRADVDQPQPEAVVRRRPDRAGATGPPDHRVVGPAPADPGRRGEVEVHQPAGQRQQRRRVGRRQLRHAHRALRHAVLPRAGAVEPGVAGQLPVHRGEQDLVGLPSLTGPRPVDQHVAGHPVGPGDGAQRRGGTAQVQLLQPRRRLVRVGLDEGGPHPRGGGLQRGCGERGPAGEGQVELGGGDGVAEPAVDRDLGGVQAAEGHPPVAQVLEVVGDHRPQHAATTVVGVHRHPGQPRHRHPLQPSERAGHGDGQVERGVDAHESAPGVR